MKAKNLREAQNRLNPDHALETLEELKEFFVERPFSPLKRLNILLKDSNEPQKILFTGHRGSGKTTELAKLAISLENDFFIIRCTAKRHLNLSDLTYADVVLSIGLELLTQSINKKIKVNPKVLTTFLDFTKDITIEVEDGDKKGKELGLEAGIDLEAVIAKIFARMRTEDTTRISIRKTLGHRFFDLLENIEFLSQEVKRVTGRPVLAIVEDLDKTDLETSENLFYRHATNLLAPRLSIIYTFPIELRLDANIMQIRSNFPNIEALPNLKIRHRDNTPDPVGRARLREILIRRVEETLFSVEALDLLIIHSAGIPRELIAMARLACLWAREYDQARIDEKAVEQAIRSRRRDYQLILTKEQIDLLRTVARSHWVENEEINQPLLKSLSALEYRNDEVWFDVHPLVLPLLEKKRPQKKKMKADES